MKFMVIVCAAFFARVNPVSTIAKPACMNITRNPATSVHTKLMATVFAAAAALAALASESAAGTPCPARTSGHARVISRPRPTERLIQPPSEVFIRCTDATEFVQKVHRLYHTTLLPDRVVCLDVARIVHILHFSYHTGFPRRPLYCGDAVRLTPPEARGQLSRSRMVLHTNVPSGVCSPRPHGGRPQPAGRKRACLPPR